MDIEFPENNPPPDNPQNDDPFGPVIYSYTRKQAIWAHRIRDKTTPPNQQRCLPTTIRKYGIMAAG